MYLFKKGKFQVSTKEFDLFLEEYQNDFTIFDLEQYISQLMSTGIVKKNKTHQIMDFAMNIYTTSF